MTSSFYICKQILANRKVPLEYGVPLTGFFPSKGVFGEIIGSKGQTEMDYNKGNIVL
jgi:hypothetical protein